MRNLDDDDKKIHVIFLREKRNDKERAHYRKFTQQPSPLEEGL